MKWPSADPYRDLAVIDERAPRFNQAVIGSLSLVAFLVDWWPLYPILAGQLALGLTLGRRYCLPCLVYFEVVQRLFGEGPLEDSRPPRFSNQLGFVVLGAASVAHVAGASVLGWTLGLLVSGLALFAAISGFCTGCQVYRLVARLRGVRSHALDRVDLAELGGGGAGPQVVQFTHPLCSDCHELERQLRLEGRDVLTVDVSRKPELARKYGIAVVPTAVSVGADGTVIARLVG
jgi:hypothetical protein